MEKEKPPPTSPCMQGEEIIMGILTLTCIMLRDAHPLKGMLRDAGCFEGAA